MAHPASAGQTRARHLPAAQPAQQVCRFQNRRRFRNVGMRRVGMLPGRMCLAEPGRATANLKVCTTKTARNIRA